MRAACIAALAILVAACASSQVAQIVTAPQPIICTAGADCDAKWSRAIAWIASNSPLRIKVKTDAVVRTEEAGKSDTTPAFTVTKVARGDGRYEIAFNGGCANRLRCVPAIAESRARFAAFVLGEELPPQLSAN